MLPQEQQVEVPPWNEFLPPPPPPGPPPTNGYIMGDVPPPPPPPPRRSPQKEHLKAAPSLEDTVASTFTAGNSSEGSFKGRNIVEERRRAASAIYASTGPVEMERLENATVNTDTLSRQFPSEMEEDQVWDPVLMDRLSPSDEVANNEFSEQRWQKPDVKSPASPVSQFRNLHSPQSQASIMVQRSQLRVSQQARSPIVTTPLSPSELRSPLSVKQHADDMIRERLRQQSLMQSFSVETSSTMLEQGQAASTDSAEAEDSVEDDSSSVENKAEEKEKSVRFSASVVSSLTDDMPKPRPPVAVSPSRSPHKEREYDQMQRVVVQQEQVPADSIMDEKDQTSQTVGKQEHGRGDNAADKKKNRRSLKRFLGIRVKETAAKESREGPSPKHRQVNGKLVNKQGLTSPKARKSKKPKNKKKSKTTEDEQIGAPRILRPGMSYKSTPNSAEIVVRTSTVEPESSDEEPDNFEENVDMVGDPPETERACPAALTVSTSIDDAAELGKLESFSPPRFDNIEEVAGTFSSSPASQDITLPSEQDHRFKGHDAFSNEEMSEITNPTFGTSTDNRFQDVGEENNRGTLEKAVSDPPENNPNSDPLGHYWGAGRNASAYSLQRDNIVDPFARPFFEDQASDVTSPVVNLSHSAEEHHNEARAYETERFSDDVPDDEIAANRSHDTNDSGPVVGPVVKSSVTNSEERDLEDSHAALRNENVARRSEILERLVMERSHVKRPTSNRVGQSLEARRNEISERRDVDRSHVNSSAPPSAGQSLEERRDEISERRDVDRSHVKSSAPLPSQEPDDSLAAPRNEIAGRRNEIMERRKSIEEKAKNQNAAEQERKKAQPQSSLTGKAVAYLRQQSDSRTPAQRSHCDVLPSAPREQRASSEQTNIPLATPSGNPDAANMCGGKAAYSVLGATLPSREQQTSAGSSLLVKLHGRKFQTITSPSRTLEASGARSSLSPSANTLSNRRSESSPWRSSDYTRVAFRPAPQRVDHASIARGMALKRSARELRIMQGKDVAVRPRAKKKPTSRRQYTQSTLDLDESKIKDPIKRAGLRLLAKAAVPIQCAIRRYLAQQVAVDRLWAIIELQSYFRRWKADAFLLAHTYSAVRIQAAFRGWQDRDILETEHYCATQIQKVARTYMVSMQAYDSLYRIIMVQAAARGLLARRRQQRLHKNAILIQRCFRGFQDRLEVATWHVAASIIQSTGRAYLARLQYQFDLVDIIIVQSVARRWLAIQETRKFQKVVIVQSVARRWLAIQDTRILQKYTRILQQVIIVQSVARRWAVNNVLSRELDEIRHYAATKIQAAWRGFQASTDFIFSLADIIIVQRTIRQWLAVKELRSLQQEAAAKKIQALWRGYKARGATLYRLVDIIIVQSVVRRRLAMNRAWERFDELEALPERIEAAVKIQSAWRGFSQFSHYLNSQSAVKIQSAWRGFSQFSHYLISQFEVIKLQAAVRGHLVRSGARLRLGCIIILQSTMRAYLVRKHLQLIKSNNHLVASKSIALRENNACRRIQMGWRAKKNMEKEAALTLERFFTMVRRVKLKREKEAALTIERFFIMVWRAKLRREKEAALTIERFFIMIKAAVELEIRRQKQRKRHHHRGRLAVSTSRSPRAPTEAVDVMTHDEDMVSDVTSPSVFYRHSRRSTRRPCTPRELEEDVCLEEAWDDTEVHEARKRRQMEEEYFQRYGLPEKESRRRRQHSSGRESPHRRRLSSNTPKGQRPPHGEEYVSHRERHRPSSRNRHRPPTSSGDGRFWSEEDRYRNNNPRTPSARTYRSAQHYEETETMRSEFSPHSSQARHSKGGRRRHTTSRERPRAHDEYDDEYDRHYDRKPHERRSPHRQSEYYEESPRRHHAESPRRRESRDGYRKRAV